MAEFGRAFVPKSERLFRPVEFVYLDLGIRLWSKQAHVLRLLTSNRRVAVRSCNGSRKTYAAGFDRLTTSAAAVVW